MMEFIKQPWPWYVAGPVIALIMFLLLWFGKKFGLSSNLKTVCSIAGAGKVSEFFRFDHRKDRWNLVFVLGAIIGGFVSASYLSNDMPMGISEETKSGLTELGFDSGSVSFLPDEIFGIEATTDPSMLSFLIIGGFLVGFGARYAGGCTSGHAISGLSDLQLPSLISVVGFFIGGLVFVHLVLPSLFN